MTGLTYFLMAERGRREDNQENISASGLSPFKSSLYRMLWTESLFSYVGAAMYDVGASWLMTSLAPDPFLVSLVTTATTLPIFLFALPSGILSDLFDHEAYTSYCMCIFVYYICPTGDTYFCWSDYPNNTIDTYFCIRSRYDYD